MANWSMIQILGLGQTQMLGPEKQGTISSEQLSTLAPFVAYLGTLQQPGTIINMDMIYAVVIMNNMFVQFMPLTESNKGQRFELPLPDMSTLNNLAEELASLLPDAVNESEVDMDRFNARLKAKRVKQSIYLQ